MNKSEMDIKVWDFNPEFFGTDNNNIIKIISGPKRNSGTNEPTGVYFRWTYWLQKNNSTILRYEAENFYRFNSDEVQLLTIIFLKGLLIDSFNQYKEILEKRLSILNLPIPNLTYQFKESQFQDLLVKLKS